MELTRINYSDLNPKQQESYNYHKVSALLADYGYSGILLADDYQGADFLAMHIDGTILKVQLKGRITISKSYIGKEIHMAFPVHGQWCLIPHDLLLEIVSSWTETKAWHTKGLYHAKSPSKATVEALQDYLIS